MKEADFVEVYKEYWNALKENQRPLDSVQGVGQLEF